MSWGETEGGGQIRVAGCCLLRAVCVTNRCVAAIAHDIPTTFGSVALGSCVTAATISRALALARPREK